MKKRLKKKKLKKYFATIFPKPKEVMIYKKDDYSVLIHKLSGEWVVARQPSENPATLDLDIFGIKESFELKADI